jgi:hypothetical protein
MNDATAQLERIMDAINQLAADANDTGSGVTLPEIGRVLSAKLLLESVLKDTRRRERRKGPAPRWGMDKSVPAGDRM